MIGWKLDAMLETMPARFSATEAQDASRFWAISRSARVDDFERRADALTKGVFYERCF